MSGSAAAHELQYPVFRLDGWAGNTRDADGVEWWVTDEDGWTDGPDVRVSLVDRPQRDGAFDARSYRSVRVITLEGVAIAPDAATMFRAKERLAALLADGSRLAPLVVAEPRTNRRTLVRLATGTRVVETSPRSFDFSIQVTAPDPIRYSTTEHSSTTGPPRRGAGLTFPLAFPLRIGESSGGRVRPSNAGTVPTAPVWQITGPVDRPVIENAATAERLAFDIVLGAGERLVIDTAVRTVLLGGQVSRRAALRHGSTWFTLPPGRTDATFGAWTFGDQSRLTVRWRDAWI